MIFAAAILTFFFLWTFIITIALNLPHKDKPSHKLKYFDEDYTLRERYENNKKDKARPFKIISSLIPRTKLGTKKAKRLDTELMKADMPITAEELLAVKILSSSAVSFLSFAVFKDYIIPPVIFIIVWNIPRLIIANRKKERIRLFDSQLNEGITIISNSLKSGYSFLQAVAVVAGETRDPFAKEFIKLLKEMSLGISEEDALKNLVIRVESEDLRLVINAILIQKDIGGNLSEILDNISETIRERQKIKSELKTLTAQGRLSGVIVTLLPIVLGIVIYLFNREYMMLLFTHPLGIGMVISAIVSELLGFIMIRKIVTIDM
ncbi:MAG: putative type secretion system protein [Clostridia bacterium]|jgi:tight adherence protein B|nr:putative type secretion system protein [Clostridia bacterium]